MPLAADGVKHADLDARALQAYQDALGPRYDIIGVVGDPKHPWAATDALHCRTRGVPVGIPPLGA